MRVNALQVDTSLPRINGKDQLAPLREVTSKGFEFSISTDMTPDWVVLANYGYNDTKITGSHPVSPADGRAMPDQGVSRISLSRLAAPRTSSNVDAGRSSALERSRKTASFALPSSGGAVVRTASGPPDAGSATASAEAPGDTRTISRPSASTSANIASLDGMAGLGRAISGYALARRSTALVLS